jgi:hypothetical protein
VPEGKPDHFHHLCHASTAACNTEISARTWMDCLKGIYGDIWGYIREYGIWDI